MRKTFAIVVAIALLATPVLAGDFQKSIQAAVRRTVADQSRPAARGENPYMVPGLALVGGGATLVVLGFISPSGVECTSDLSATNVSCGTTANKGLVFAGAGAAALGGLLLMKGEKARAMPEILGQRGRFVVRQRIRW
jgi:hypothetical protein